MAYVKTFVLMPSHSLDDFPVDLGDEQAASLLNHNAVSWHPALLAQTGLLPQWHRADVPPPPTAGLVVFVPEVAEQWLTGGWIEQTRGYGVRVIAGALDRDALIGQLFPEGEESGGDWAAADPDLVGDFFALGTCFLQMELLSRQQRYFTSLDELTIQTRAVAAARAWLAGESALAREKLRSCFERLHESREKFYPPVCYQVDLCLVAAEQSGDLLAAPNTSARPMNLLFSGEVLEEIAAMRPDVANELANRLGSGTTEVVGGELMTPPTSLVPLGTSLWHLAEGLKVYENHLRMRPVVWGRRSFGLAAGWPQWLERAGFRGALHIALDDGIYPDEEHSRFRWQGFNGSQIRAMSRIPLPVESAGSYLRFASRLSESMDHDEVGAVVWARWPAVKSPFFEDFLRIAHYAPVLGEFSTISHLLTAHNSGGPVKSHAPQEYWPPNLLHHVALREPAPISRYASHIVRHQKMRQVGWCQTLVQTMLRQHGMGASIEREIELAVPGEEIVETERLEAIEQRLDAERTNAAERLAKLLVDPAVSAEGWLLINPSSTAVTLPVTLATKGEPPATAERRVVTVPGGGFAWVPRQRPVEMARGEGCVVDDFTLRTDLFEVTIHPETGGIARVRRNGERANRLSQQLGIRFAKERPYRTSDETEETDPEMVRYSPMKLISSEVIGQSASYGAIRTTGELIDPERLTALARFTQTVTVWPGASVFEVKLSIELLGALPADPWNEYLAARFAWNDSQAALTRTVMGAALPVGMDRFECTGGIEIAEEDCRVSISTGGLPFHRRHGERMFDTLLQVPGETANEFRFLVGLDQPCLGEFSEQLLVEPLVVPVASKLRGGIDRGWLLNFDQRNVRLIRLQRSEKGLGLLMVIAETEGVAVSLNLHCFWNPQVARRVGLDGTVLSELVVTNDSVRVELASHEVAWIEVLFD